MADGCEVQGSDLTNTEEYLVKHDSPLLEHFVLRDGRLHWEADLKLLKEFVKDSLQLNGKWSSPGGEAKKFKSSNDRISIIWYCKKQLTITFQGKDGDLLKERLTEAVKAKLSQATDKCNKPQSLIVNESLSHKEDLVKGSVNEAQIRSPTGDSTLSSTFSTTVGVNTIRSPPTEVIDVESQQAALSFGKGMVLGNQCSCTCREIAADMEGIKLELLILEKRIDAGLGQNKNHDHKNMDDVFKENKMEYERLQAIISEKDKEAAKLKQKIMSLESRATSAEEERDSLRLRLALTLIMQDKGKAGGQYQQQKSQFKFKDTGKRDRESHSRKTNPEQDSIHLKNRFQPLEDDMNTSNEGQSPIINENDRPLRKDNGSVKSLRKQDQQREQNQHNNQNRPSRRSREEDKSTRKSRGDDKTPRKKVIVGDSILKNLKGYKMSKNNKVKVYTFSGCTTKDMFDHVKPVLRKEPDQIIIHVGTNSLRDSQSPEKCANEIVDLARSVESLAPETEVVLSSLVARSDDNELAQHVTKVNAILKKFSRQNHWKLIEHSNITAKHHLNRSGLHLNKAGTIELARNFINFIREED